MNVFLDYFIKKTPSCEEFQFFKFILIVGYQVYAWDHRSIFTSMSIWLSVRLIF